MSVETPLTESMVRPRLDRRTLVTWLGLALITVGFTLSVIQHSYKYGRLQAQVVFDDCGYFLDGIRRIHIYEDEGLIAAISSFRTQPAHSLFSTLYAIASFKVFGTDDWAPYAGNGLIVLLTLVYALRLVRGMPGVGVALAIGLVLTIPVVAYSVHEFRPDLACALVTAIMLCELVLTGPAERTWKKSLLIGFLFGLALNIKPTVFPVTGLLTGGAMLACLLRDVIDPERRPYWRKTLGFMMAVGLVGLAVFTPHFLLIRETLVDYIVSNIFGSNRSFWVYKGTNYDHVTFYFIGYGGRFGIGALAWVLVAWFVAALLLVRGSWRTGDRATLITLGAVTLGAIALPTLNEVKQPFFGGVFYYLMAFGGLLSCAWLVRRFDHFAWKGFVLSFLLAATMFGVYKIKFPILGMGIKADAPVVQRQVYEIVSKVARSHCRLQFHQSGWINSATLSFMLERDGLRQLHLVELWPYGDLKKHEEHMSWGDIIIASSPSTGLVDEQFPSGKIQNEIVAIARQRPDLVEIATVPTANGGAFHIFGRRTYLADLPSSSTLR